MTKTKTKLMLQVKTTSKMEDVSKNLNKYREFASYYSCIYHIPPDEGLVDKIVWQACHCGYAGISFVNSPSPSIYLPLTSQP